MKDWIVKLSLFLILSSATLTKAIPDTLESPKTSGELYLKNNNNKAIVKPYIPHRMVVTLDRTVGKTRSIPIDNDHLRKICADEDGCTIEMGITGFDNGAGVHIVSPMMGPSCRFYLRESSRAIDTWDWAVSSNCHTNYIATQPSESEPYKLSDLKRYLPYASGRFGTDGSDADRWPVIEYLGLCFFAESTPKVPAKKGDFYMPDKSGQFYLITSDFDWLTSSNSPMWSPSGSCKLLISN